MLIDTFEWQKEILGVMLPKKMPVLFIIGIILPLLSISRLRAQDPSPGSPFLKDIVINTDSTVPVSGLPAAGPGNRSFEFGHHENNLAFQAGPEGQFEYRFFLEGFDKKRSRWLRSGFKEYTNLPAGKYVLHTWFRSRDTTETEMSPLTFRIKPAWYLTFPARIIYLIVLLSAVLSSYSLLRSRFRKKESALKDIISKKTIDFLAEKEKTEKLLQNVLPKDTANEIMAKGKATKMKYNFVTVLFSDIQGFTQIAEEMNPELLIDELDKFFFHFDTVVEKYGIEKIKTIGDAYMCAGGIPEKNRTNPVEVILAGLEMQEYMARLKASSQKEGMKYWDIRIGIHTGTVIAGVVGHKKLSYDIWGDTVNTASRMESSGEAGRVNISGTTYEFVKEFFECEHRGKMPVKYKGELDMYFVRGIIPGLRDENGTPNEKFRFRMQLIKLQDVEEAVDKLFIDETPPNLYFHNGALSRNITSQVDLLANAENTPEEEYLSLKLASVFVISGFMIDYERPAEAALDLMDEVLPRYGFDQLYISRAKEIISNSFDCRYVSAADKILHDARYDYLGRVDYRKLTDKLLKERKEHGIVTDAGEWVKMQERLLHEHDFLTATGRLLRSVSPEAQIASLGNPGQ